MRVLTSRRAQSVVAGGGVILLSVFLVVQVTKDLTADVGAWYFHSTPIWVLVMAVATLIFAREWKVLLASGADVDAMFRELPPE